MKLYTEEDIRKAWNTAYTDALSIDELDYKPKFYEDFIQSVTPIELPTDEEIKEYSLHYSEMQEDVSDKLGKYLVKAVHMDGAQWVINKIKGGNQ